jgi:hypothetical protein
MDSRMQGDGQSAESWVDTKTMGRALSTLCSALARQAGRQHVITTRNNWQAPALDH